MKITHVISDTNVGGAGILLSNIVTSLEDKFDFEVILPKGSQLIERLHFARAKVTPTDMSGDVSFSPRDARSFYKLFKSSPPDIIHTHASLSARVGGLHAGVKNLLSTRHCAKSVGAEPPSRLMQRMYGAYTTRTVSTADAATRDLVREGVPPASITTIKNGTIPVEKITPEHRRKLLAELGFDGVVTVIGSCARIEHIKGQDLILRAAPKILARHPEVRFLFVGDGGERRACEKLAATLGIGGRVKFIGYAANAREYENLFFININASRGTETSCLVTSECMSLGIPTVASDFGGNPEMVKDGESGLLFQSENAHELADRVNTLLSDQNLYDRLSRGAREHFSKDFSVERMAEEYERLYLSLQGQGMR
ncbi:MAG: glycosyltransferase family 4 protein [Clostridia bacterium]|nr:glycosyltransferase family 4 protein [Clostridia bacterium]MBQ8720132.1 glycosyltransferase family 4 protein [Clostridia bacterium]